MKISRNFSFSTVDGIGNIFESLLTISIPSWAGFYIIGLVAGAFGSSILIKEFKINTPSKQDFVQFFGGGLLLGLGC